MTLFTENYKKRSGFAVFFIGEALEYGYIMSIGLKRGEVRLENHQIEWEDYAKSLISKLKSILGDDALGIEHIGSTAIPAIKAKPIIDIAIGVETLNVILPYNKILNENGFVFRGADQEEQLLYIVRDERNPDIIKSHIHVVTIYSQAWKNYFLFRDFLKKNKEAAKQYEELKTKLAKKYKNDRKSYTSSKQLFIEEMIQLAALEN